MRLPLDDLNLVGRAEFVSALGGIFEHSPWVAERVRARRPFNTVEDLHRAMCETVAQADEAEQLALIRAHPELAGKAAIRGELTVASRQEQRGAGLDQCSPEEYARLKALNDAYQARFGFPFIIAVRGHTRGSIIEAMDERLRHDRDTEFVEALQQIEKIAAFRLADLLRKE